MRQAERELTDEEVEDLMQPKPVDPPIIIGGLWLVKYECRDVASVWCRPDEFEAAVRFLVPIVSPEYLVHSVTEEWAHSNVIDITAECHHISRPTSLFPQWIAATSVSTQSELPTHALPRDDVQPSSAPSSLLTF